MRYGDDGVDGEEEGRVLSHTAAHVFLIRGYDVTGLARLRVKLLGPRTCAAMQGRQAVGCTESRRAACQCGWTRPILHARADLYTLAT